MNQFTVDWDADAERELADIWIGASDRKAVAQAQARIDRLLARDPIGNGRLLSEGLWQIVDPPLTVSYSIDDVAKAVQVSWVARTA